nr:hypothetical protein PCNR482_0058 [Klebsiella pneumoniae]
MLLPMLAFSVLQIPHNVLLVFDVLSFAFSKAGHDFMNVA